MSDELLEKITDNIITAKVGLLLRHPFFGNISARLKILEGGEWCQTAATDGRHIFFSRTFFEKLSVREIEFVIAHEILHNVFDHMTRRESRHPRIFNFANDYCVNGQIVRDKIGDHGFFADKMLHDTKYYGMSSEEIYDHLKDLNDEMLNKLGDLVDQHIDWSKPDPNDPSRPVYSQDELNTIRDEMREKMISASQAAGSEKTPELVRKMIEEFGDPKIDWRALLRQHIQSLIKDDYSWMRPNRKSWHLAAVLPGSNLRNTIDVCICIDMSGSIGDDQAKDFLSEIKGIMEEYQDFKIKLWCFDTQVYNEQDFDGYSMDDFHTYQPTGGGGTDFMCNWDYMKENDIAPQKLIMFTDMYPCGSWGDEDYCDTIFIGHGTTTIVPPFGDYAYYEFDTKTQAA